MICILYIRIHLNICTYTYTYFHVYIYICIYIIWCMLFTYMRKRHARTIMLESKQILKYIRVLFAWFHVSNSGNHWIYYSTNYWTLHDPPRKVFGCVFVCFCQVFLDPQATSVEIPWFLRYSGSYFPKPFENTPPIGNSEIYQQFQAPKNGGILTYISCTVIM